MTKALKTWSHVSEWQKINFYLIKRWPERQISIREKESNEVIRQKDMKIEEHVEAVTTLKMRNLG